MQDLKAEPETSAPPQMSLGLQFLVAAVLPVAGLFLAMAANAMSFEVRGYYWLGPVVMLASFLFGASYILPFARRSIAGESDIAPLGAIFLFMEYPLLALVMMVAHAFRFGIAA